MKKTVLILIDACRHDYLNRGITPFLDALKKSGEYTEKIIPGNGFCERAEIFTGKKPSDTGFFTAIDYSKNRRQNAGIAWILNFLAFVLKLLPFRLVEKIVRRLLWEYSIRTAHPMHPQKIPLNLIKYFSLTEDYVDMREEGALGCNSIFDYMRSRRLKFFYDSFTALNLPSRGDDQDRLNLVIDNAKEDFSLYLVYIGSLDATGHKYGPLSSEINNAIQKTDEQLSNFSKEFSSINPEAEYIFLGDHGMTDVHSTVDVDRILKSEMHQYGLKLGADYIYFLDSTLMRVWIFDIDHKNEIMRSISENSILKSKGKFVNEDDATLLEIPINNNSADIIWWANLGVMISPDFFHRKVENIKGMHGYFNMHDDSKGFCIDTRATGMVESDDITSVYSKIIRSL